MEATPDYRFHLDIKYAPLEKIDVNDVIAKCTDPWFNQTLSQINGSVLRIGIVQGEFHWHKHEDDDELFYVLSGRLFVDTEGGNFELGPNEGVTVPRGVLHRTRAMEKTVMLMIENAGIQPAGD
ncbi:MAG: cupin domain-containing protein [Bacteroidota bacterium]|nr:cupin domain-containing protein [Bacteroidota bacterium]MDP4234544.1 cupin domain-containing protein [Bacteroidota bacterium]MDP4242609.1 cupin domain-containing protein [Bacteroidota bacterium]MDP4289185.1 cupin domain-containing protein [Bacteroidota bacterium]